MKPIVPRVVTTLRPPQAIVDAIDCAAHHARSNRSEVIREAVEDYLAQPDAERSVRMAYARINSKLARVPISFSVRPSVLRRYRSAASRLEHGSLAGLVTLAVASKHKLNRR
jgi:hypothetical protein